MKKMIYLLMILALISSCGEKGGETFVYGRIIDRLTGTPLPGSCILVEGTKRHRFLQSEVITIESTQAEANGKFEFRLEHNEVTYYTLSVYKGKDGICSSDFVQLEYLDFDCGSSNCTILYAGTPMNSRLGSITLLRTIIDLKWLRGNLLRKVFR